MLLQSNMRYWIVVNYREAYKMFACNGILFNHRSPLRGETFVTRKITIGLSRIKLGMQKIFSFGQSKCKKRLGSCKSYVEAMWEMLQLKNLMILLLLQVKQFTVRFC